MKRIRLESSAIVFVSYNEDERTLDVEFRDEDIYRYIHVPKFVYNGLLSAESAGAFWNQIKGNYEFTRLDKTNRRQ